MKCPICTEELRNSQKNPEYALCDTCRKKFRISSLSEPTRQSDAMRSQSDDDRLQDQTSGISYSNIPPRQTREKGEQRIKQEYEAMLALDDPYEHRGNVVLRVVGVLVVFALIIVALVLLNGHFQWIDLDLF